MKTAFAAFLGLLLCAGPASAVVVVSGSDSASIDTTANDGTFNYTLQGGGNALVFALYVDNASPVYSNILLNGSAPDGTVQDDRVLLAYQFDPNAFTTVTFDVNPGSATDDTSSGFFLYELSYVDTGQTPDFATSDPNTGGGTGASIVTSSNNRFVVDFQGINNGPSATPAGGSIVTSFTNASFNGAGGGGALGAATGVAGAAGSQTLGWANFTAPGFAQGETAAAFVAAAGGPTPWNVDGGGSWNDPNNWFGGSLPTSGGLALLGDVHTDPNTPAVITLDSAVNAGTILFSNENTYEIAGPSTLTLSGAATLQVGNGSHEVSADIAGSAGLTKTGGGDLTLTGSNSYTGATTISAGSLQLPQTGAVPSGSAVSIGASGELRFVGDGAGNGYSGAFSNTLSGDGDIALDVSLTTETVTRSTASSHSGQIVVDGGTLAISHDDALGSGDGSPATGTVVSTNGSQGTGKLALSGDITVGPTELLTLFPRRGDPADFIHVTSDGNNTWQWNILGSVNGDNYNFESTSGTLTLGGVLAAPDNDTGVRNFVFTGNGNYDITGAISDADPNVNGQISAASAEVNVHVYKRGNGTLKISTASSNNDEYWDGDTFIEDGKLEVISSGGTVGELFSRSIDVSAGAIFDIDSFTTYNLQVNQSLSGGGTIQAQTLGIFNDSTVSPGDSVGTMTITGNVTLNAGGSGGALDFEMGADPNAVSDFISISGTLVNNGITTTVGVTPVEGVMAPGTYQLISYSGTAVSTTGLTASFFDATGASLTVRQSLGLSSSTGELNLTVTGNAGDLTWTGDDPNGVWDVNTTANWEDPNGASETFYDFDVANFDDSATPDPNTVNNVTADISNGDVRPSQANFTSATGRTFTITGTNGFLGSTPINLTGNATVELQNTNTLQGEISLDPNTTLDLGAGNTLAGDGDITGSGTLVISGNTTLTNALSLTGPIILTGQVFPQNAAALGTTDSGTTLAPGANLWYNFQNLSVAEPLNFDGGLLNVAGNDGSALTLTGALTVDEGGGNIVVNPGLGDDALIIESDISGTGSGALTVNVSTGSLMTVNGDITFDGTLTKTGTGTLTLGASTSLTTPEVIVDGGDIDVTAQSALSLGSGQTLAGDFGTVTGNVTATSGSTIRVGEAGGITIAEGIFHYTDATWGNTYPTSNTVVAADDTALTPVAGDFDGDPEWGERAFANESTILQGGINGGADNAPTLKTIVAGLDPNTQYDVYVNFWNDGSDWRIQAGDSEGTLSLFTTAESLVMTDPNVTFATEVLTVEGNRTMWGAPLTLTTNSSGELELFVDEDSFNGMDERTWYDGLSVIYDDVVAQSLTVTGDLTMAAGSTLEFDIATPGSSDLLTIGGALAVSDGLVLDVALDEDVDPLSLAENDSWTLLDFGSASGTFDPNDFSLPTGLAAYLVWDTSSLLVDGTLSLTAVAPQPGDFDEDGDVDGSDFLLWQRDPSVGDLADWEDNYGYQWETTVALTAAIAAVPEPGTAVLLLAGILASGGVVRRRRSC